MRNKKEKQEESKTAVLSDETKKALTAIIFLVGALFLFLAAYSKAGIVGNLTYRYLSLLFGGGFFLTPVVFLMSGFSFLRGVQYPALLSNTFMGILTFMLGGVGIVEIILGEKRGGVVGNLMAFVLDKLFGMYVSMAILGSLLVIGVILIFDKHLSYEWSLFGRKLGKREKETGTNVLESADEKKAAIDNLSEEKPVPPVLKERLKSRKNSEDEDEIPINKLAGKNYQAPPVSLLEQDSGKPGVGDIKANANIIKRTMSNFGIEVEMDEVSIGPSITRYALKPAEGVKLSRIVGLQDNLALALAAHPLRIEAPIPGKSLVGIEIPNTTKSLVGLGSLLASTEFERSPYPLLVALGRGISGISHFANLAKAPHLLIAGATGSGKSVCIHSIIVSLLYRNSPESLRFIMIDPKRVELTLYNKIPHLLTPVVTEYKKCILVLKWVIKEMERRYDILEAHAVRDIQSYHKNIKDALNMPYIVVIIDELADIMTSYPRELEAAVVRLAQMSRAVGIHLILSTQRPSVEVITGLIKANIPSRIALQVPSQIDSRTIIDGSGAEKLLGAGDMLYLSGDAAKPSRIQSTYISENEVKKVVKFLQDHYQGEEEEINLVKLDSGQEIIFSENETEAFPEGDDEDELYEEAKEMVLKTGKASTSYLQRRFKIGYARAARLIDMMEERGVVGPGEGAKPREVYILNSSQTGSITPDEEKEI